MRHSTVFAIAAFCVAAPAAVLGHTLHVDCGGGGDYLTIQEAVEAAGASDTIRVAACVYEERVVIPDIPLVIIGDGADDTEITWSGSMGTVEFQESPLALHSLTVSNTSTPNWAVHWDEGPLKLVDCVIHGWVRGGQYHGEVNVSRCRVDRLLVSGGFNNSTVVESRFGKASFCAAWQGFHNLLSSDSFYGELEAGSSECQGDSIGYIELWGQPDAYQAMEAQACHIDTCVAFYSPTLVWEACEIGAFTYEADHFDGPAFDIRNCLFTRDVVVSGAYRHPLADTYAARGYRFEHNTILGGFAFDMATSHAQQNNHIQSNIAVGPSVISCDYEVVVSHNDFVGGLSLNAPLAEVHDNISEDPQFCGAPVGDFTVHEDSPCNGGAHDGSVIGAFEVGCYVPVERASWGAIKAKFR